jgi:hypothetical protein
MSGGSFNYLYSKDLCQGGYELREMADWLRTAGFEDIAVATEACLASCEPPDELRYVWKAVEWFESGDWGMHEVAQAVKEYHHARQEALTPREEKIRAEQPVDSGSEPIRSVLDLRWDGCVRAQAHLVGCAPGSFTVSINALYLPGALPLELVKRVMQWACVCRREGSDLELMNAPVSDLPVGSSGLSAGIVPQRGRHVSFSVEGNRPVGPFVMTFGVEPVPWQKDVTPADVATIVAAGGIQLALQVVAAESLGAQQEEPL